MWKGGYFLFGLVLIVAAISYWEFVRLAAKKGANAQLIPGELLAIACVFALHFNTALLMPVFIVLMILILFVEIYRKNGSPILNISATIFGGLFFSLLFGSFILVHKVAFIYNIDPTEVGQWILLLILSTWACDSAAMIIGSYLGRHKLMPRISPNKSIEGTVAGFFVGVLAAYICHIWFIDDLSPLHSMAIGAIAGSFGQYGDLFESMLKRDANVKDSSNLIPGHGGMMDRFDSLAISAPIMYLYLIYVVF
jgi:phosphatidate cytidylyltransferase